MSARFVINSVGGYDTTGKHIAIVGTGSSRVQIAGALSSQAASLVVYQRTPAWVLPKIDFDIPPWMRRLLRLPGMVGVVNVLGRVGMDAFMLSAADARATAASRPGAHPTHAAL